ncbi:MAG: carbon storage regulator CsrA [Cryobacterium sp.]|uniref:carbon storage regulator CsrA n=1 Tax=unclassified Cryobacterium TaxID=2649013 RepID=UPI0018C9B69A|nr:MULTISPECIES: carbon storage regulator CsrA [unclassified Cryobacterium]MCY7404465.1 carbon storage regulator CsrA [Cryobacterium sp.]MEC5153971.1 carbon storage regulator [Cryobacterium sp. CAN_C3]
MLVLTRKLGEKILIGDDIVITVLDARGDSVRIGIDAPRGVKIQRDEVVRAVIEANQAASAADDDAANRIKRSLGIVAGLQSAHSRQSQADASPQAAAPATESPGSHGDSE